MHSHRALGSAPCHVLHRQAVARARAALACLLGTIALLHPWTAHAHGASLHGGPAHSASARSGQTTVAHPQWACDPAGATFLLWGILRPPAGAQATGTGGDLLLARRESGTALTLPVQVNDAAATVQLMDFDEIRPSLAIGPQGRMAVAWTDVAGDVRVAESLDGGQSFAPAVRLNQDEGTAAQAFVVVAYDHSGRLHAAWLDARFAPPREEEPSHLYHAVLAGESVDEQCLTCKATPSVCGCCRPWMGAMPDGGVEIFFRNTSSDGYRDIHRVTVAADGTVGRPSRLGPAMWKIKGCPTAGPVLAAGHVVWRDGSQGHMRLMAVPWMAGKPPALDAAPSALSMSALEPAGATPAADGLSGAWESTRSVRAIAAPGAGTSAVLAPGEPGPAVLVRTPGGLEPIAQPVPAWCNSAALAGATLLCAGVEAGKLMVDEVAWSAARP